MSAVSEFQQQEWSSEKHGREVGSGSRFADSWRSRRAKLTSDDERLDVTAEVDRGGDVVDLVRQDGQLVVNPFTNREPMQLLDEWLKVKCGVPD